MPPRKRKAAASKGPSKAAKKEEKPKAKELTIPVDEGFFMRGDVHVANDGTIFDVSLNQSQVAKNTNKFYRLQVIHAIDDWYYCHTRWGRVGEYGQVKTIGPLEEIEDAIKEFYKKFKEKSGLKWEERHEEPKPGKYAFIDRSYESDDNDDDTVKKEENEEESKPEIESKLPVQTQRLMELIFNENHFNSVLESIGYNSEKLPLGKLGKSTIEQGFKHLKELASLIKHPSLAKNKYGITQREAIEDFTDRYYTAIPHIFGRNRPPMIDNWDLLQKEVAMLDTLTDMGVASSIMKTTDSKHKDAASVSKLDQRFAQLNLTEAEPLDPKSKEYQALKDYLINTAGQTHNIRYRLQDIFRIERDGEQERFDGSQYSKTKDKNRRLLWHGSRSTNYGGILSQGLRIAPPEAPVNGYAFGKGVYLADVSTKSANYCVASSSGGHGLLMLCEAELGNPMYELLTGDSAAAELSAKAGSIATFGVGRTCPQGWVDAGDAVDKSLRGIMMPDPKKPPADQTQHPNAYLQYNEYICYDVKQIRLRYLIRFSL